MIKMIDRLKELIGKKVFIEISGRRFYNGVIENVSDTHVFLIDKYNEKLLIAISDIRLLQSKEVKE